MADYEFINDWIIKETSYKPEEETSKATVFATANGYMGLRGAGEELKASIPGAKGCYINGIYDTPEGKLTEREFPNIQDWTAISFTVDGEPFDLSTGKIISYCREIDMKLSVIRRRIEWESPKGKVVTLSTERFLSITRIHLGVIRYAITAAEDCLIDIQAGIDADVNNRWASHFKKIAVEYDNHNLFMQTETTEPGYNIAVRTVDACEPAPSAITANPIPPLNTSLSPPLDSSLIPPLKILCFYVKRFFGKDPLFIIIRLVMNNAPGCSDKFPRDNTKGGSTREIMFWANVTLVDLSKG